MGLRKTLILTMTIFVIVPIMLISFLYTGIGTNAIYDLKEEQLTTLAGATAHNLGKIVELEKEIVTVLSGDKQLINYLEEIKNEEEAQAENLADNEEYISSLISLLLAQNAFYSDILIIDTNGNAVMSQTGNYSERNFKEQDIYIYPYHNKEVFVSKEPNFVIGTEGAIVFSRAVRDHNEEFLGLVVFLADANYLAGYTSNVASGKTGLCFVIDNNDNILFHPDDAINKQKVSIDGLKNLLTKYRDAQIPKSGTLTYEFEKDKERLLAYYIMPELSWTFVVQQDFDDFLSATRLALTAIGILCILIVLLIVYVSKKIEDRSLYPIMKLKSLFDEANKYKRYMQCDTEDKFEIGEMIQSYNKMIKTLHEDNELTMSAYKKSDAQSKTLKESYSLLLQEKEQNEHLAFHDAVTGLNNRVYFERELEKYTIKGDMFSVFFIDLDNFKNVNDIYGHNIGDGLLNAVGNELSSRQFGFDTVCRTGGDEFSLIKVCDKEEAARVAQQLIARMTKPIFVSTVNIYISASIGIVMYPFDSNAVETLIKYAEIAMYKAKGHGKKNYCFFGDEMHEEIARENKITSILRSCIVNDELYMMYQPIYKLDKENLDKRQIVGFESLLRLHSKELGIIDPGEFIPIAEESGLISEIGHFALSESCKFMKNLVDKNIDVSYVSVNVSFAQLTNDLFELEVSNVLTTYDLEPHYLQLELTETLFVSEIKDNIKKLDEIKKYGVRIALDDFGTNYSSLNYLTILPINSVKIDKSFMRKVYTHEKNKIVFRSMIDLCHELDFTVAAEGIEKIEEFETVSKMGCDECQGYLMSKPLNEKDIYELWG